MRKTLNVAVLLETANNMLSLDTINQDEKKAICMLTETMLHKTGNYQGFGYQFVWNQTPKKERERREYDRVYYVSRTLKNEYERLTRARERANSA